MPRLLKAVSPWLLAVVAAGCEAPKETVLQPTQPSKTSGSAAVALQSFPEGYRQFRFPASWTKRSADDLVSRVERVANAMDLVVNRDSVLLVARSERRKVSGVVSTGSTFSYERLHDDLKVSADERFPSLEAPDVGESQARIVAERVLERLAVEALVERSSLSPQPRLSTTTGGMGTGGGDQAEPQVVNRGTLEYIYTYHRVLNGIPILNSAVRIMVSRDGKPRLVRIADVGFESAADGVPLASVEISPTVTRQQVEARLRSEVPSADLLNIEVGYVLDRAGKEMEPRWVVDFATVTSTDEGTWASRRQRLGYSAAVEAEAPIDYMASDRPLAPSDIRPE